MREAVILDIDGTIADCSHRTHHVRDGNTRWDLFFGAMANDTVFAHTETVVRALEAYGLPIVVVTARPDDLDYRQVTLDWLQANDIPYHAFYMRNSGDYRKDSIVKSEILDQMMQDGWMPVFALDDRNSVTELWRSKGIPCLQVNDGDFDKRDNQSRYAGKELLHMLIGPVASGKSTYASANYKPHEIISSDAIRVQEFGEVNAKEAFLPENMSRIWKNVHGQIKSRLDAGFFTVCDTTNLKRKDRMAVLETVPKGVLVRYLVFDRRYEDKVRDRGWRSEELIAKYHQRFKSAAKEILRGDDQPNVFVSDKREYKL